MLIARQNGVPNGIRKVGIMRPLILGRLPSERSQGAAVDYEPAHLGQPIWQVERVISRHQTLGGLNQSRAVGNDYRGAKDRLSAAANPKPSECEGKTVKQAFRYSQINCASDSPSRMRR